MRVTRTLLFGKVIALQRNNIAKELLEQATIWIRLRNKLNLLLHFGPNSSHQKSF